MSYSVSYNIKVQFNKIPLNSECLQGDWVVPGTLSAITIKCLWCDCDITETAAVFDHMLAVYVQMQNV